MFTKLVLNQILANVFTFCVNGVRVSIRIIYHTVRWLTLGKTFFSRCKGTTLIANPSSCYNLLAKKGAKLPTFAVSATEITCCKPCFLLPGIRKLLGKINYANYRHGGGCTRDCVTQSRNHPFTYTWRSINSMTHTTIHLSQFFLDGLNKNFP